jgi:hypothetical protein
MTLSSADCLYEAVKVCFTAAQPTSSSPIFGVVVFLTAVAIFAVAYSMSDDKYKFRISIAWLPLGLVLFLATTFVGIALIIVALWFELALPIPRVLNNQRYFEAFFGKEPEREFLSLC